MSKSRLARLSSQVPEVAELQEKLRTAEERIAQLTAPGEYSELIGKLDHEARTWPKAPLEKLLWSAATAIEQLQARVRELEPDAERYRWLRDHYKWANDSMRELWFDPAIKAPCLSPPYPVGIVDQDAVKRLRAELDAAIDAARKEHT